MESERELRDSILEISVNAALAGHDLGPFEPVETFEGAGYQASCRRCGFAASVGEKDRFITR